MIIESGFLLYEILNKPNYFTSILLRAAFMQNTFCLEKSISFVILLITRWRYLFVRYGNFCCKEAWNSALFSKYSASPLLRKWQAGH